MMLDFKEFCRLTLILTLFVRALFLSSYAFLLESCGITESTDSCCDCVSCGLLIVPVRLLGNVEMRCYLTLFPFLDEAKAFFSPMLLPVLGLIPVLLVIELLGNFTTCLSVKYDCIVE